MKKITTLIVALCAIALSGCTSGVFEEITPVEPIEEALPDLTAGFADEGQTKTYVEEGKYLRWHEEDQIVAFFGNTLNRQYRFEGETGANSGTFKLVPNGILGTGNSLDAIYAVYPYDADASITDKGVISLNLPATQYYAEDSFGLGANTMIAVTESVEDTFLPFKNACGYLKLKLYNENGDKLRSIEVKGNNDEKIAGAATATIEFGGVPTLVMGEDATTIVTLDCGEEGIALGTTKETATELWIVLPATTFENGITIFGTDTRGYVFEKSTNQTIEITRNEIQPISTKAVFKPTGPANNEIWYTNGSTTEATTPYKTDVFGANIVSNTYNDILECWVITFDDEVTLIGESAFSVGKFTSITIPNTVTEIGKHAFWGGNITSFTIPESVTKIGESAFGNCDNLTSITIPEGVTSIEWGAFSSCDNLSEFKGKFASQDGRYLVVNGTLNSFARAGITEYIIPEGVTKLGIHSFSWSKNLTSVTIPESVTEINNFAFTNCTSLTSITIPESVTKIGGSIFSDCTNLAEVYCKAITPPSYVYGESSKLFDNNAPGRKIYVPAESVDAYKSAKGWKNYADDIVGYDFEKGEVVPAVPANNELWYTNGSTTKATAPNKTDVFGANIISNEYDEAKECWVITFDGDVTEVGDFAFYNHNNLTSVTLPNSITSIGYRAFCGCNYLKSINIPEGVTSIGNNAFRLCESLTSITIPNSVTSIEEYSFSDCYNLAEFKGKFASQDGRCLVVDGELVAFAPAGITEYIIPEEVFEIADGTFRSYSNLTSITIPNSDTSIGAYAFAGCSSLAEFKGVNASQDGRCYIINGEICAFAPAGITEYIIPEGVTKIGDRAFCDCSNLTSVIIPNSVTSIGVEAFDSCSSLASITIPESVAKIGMWAFSGCSTLKSVYCKPTTPPQGGSSMFNYNASGRKIYVPAESVDAYKSANYWSSYADDILAYEVAATGPANNEIWYTTTDGKAITPYATDVFGANIISNEYDEAKECFVMKFDGDVTSIGNNAFYSYANYSNCKKIKSIVIPSSVTSIGIGAFHNCYNLQSINIHNNIVEFGRGAFYDCHSLKSIDIGKGITTIGASAFYNCGLTNITIPDNVTSIGESAFYGCNFEEIIWPNSIKKIGDYMFHECIYLSNIIIPEGVTSIGDSAFRECESLTSIILPKSIKWINAWAFYNSGLTELYIKAPTPPSVDNNAFGKGAGLSLDFTVIGVPEESISSYQQEYPWANYRSKIIRYNFE